MTSARRAPAGRPGCERDGAGVRAELYGAAARRYAASRRGVEDAPQEATTKPVPRDGGRRDTGRAGEPRPAYRYTVLGAGGCHTRLCRYRKRDRMARGAAGDPERSGGAPDAAMPRGVRKGWRDELGVLEPVAWHRSAETAWGRTAPRGAGRRGVRVSDVLPGDRRAGGPNGAPPAGAASMPSTEFPTAGDGVLPGDVRAAPMLAAGRRSRLMPKSTRVICHACRAQLGVILQRPPDHRGPPGRVRPAGRADHHLHDLQDAAPVVGAAHRII